jgi:hypothetical protein
MSPRRGKITAFEVGPFLCHSQKVSIFLIYTIRSNRIFPFAVSRTGMLTHRQGRLG